jgi:hypothetical protein
MYVKYILGNVRVGIPLNDFSPSHLYVFLKPGPEFLASYVVFNGLRWEVVVCFIDIGGITVDHHYLIFVYTCINATFNNISVILWQYFIVHQKFFAIKEM